ncbi:MAG: nitrilase-related carbon-nitrogen hydrolase, partial [Bacteroidota bacterium]
MTTQKNYTVGLIQMAFGKDPEVNLQRAIAKIENAARKGAQLVCLPELFRSQYFCQSENA